MQAKGRAKKSEVIKLSEETVKGTIDAEWLAVEVAGLVYNSGKANIFNILESIYEDEYDPRLRANKKLAENIISGISRRSSRLIRDVLGNWKAEVEAGGEVSPEDVAEAKREYEEARKVAGLPKIMDIDEVAAYIANETGIDIETVASVLETETDWMKENGFVKENDEATIITHTDVKCPYCGIEFRSMVILTEDDTKDNLAVKNLPTDTCPLCGEEISIVSCTADLSVKLEVKKL